MTLLRDEEEVGGGLDLSHLTSGGAAHGMEAAASAPAGGAGLATLQGGNLQPAGANNQQAGVGAGGAAMDVDAQPERAAGGGEQPPAGPGDVGADADPMSVLPPEMQHPPEGQCDPDIQASKLGRGWGHAAIGAGLSSKHVMRAPPPPSPSLCCENQTHGLLLLPCRHALQTGCTCSAPGVNTSTRRFARAGG